MDTTPHDTILSRLVEAYGDGGLDDSLTPEVLPRLAKALEPHIQRYVEKEGSLPKPAVFRAVANNFNRDGPRVQALLATRDLDEQGLWKDLRERLVVYTCKWSDLCPADQDDIAQAAWIRIHRHLEDFLFMAKLTTWVSVILENEYRRWNKRWMKSGPPPLSMDQPVGDKEGSLLGELLPSEDSSLEQVEIEMVLERLGQVMMTLGDNLDIRILRLHSQGYTLEEIRQALGPNAPSVPTLFRRLRRIKHRMQTDELVCESARQLGIFP